ncbi:MAG: arsenate reductase [Chloroflexota bacterium]
MKPEQIAVIVDAQEPHTKHSARLIVVQIFGTKKHAGVRKALRFFAERRVPTHFVDLEERGIAARELDRFVQKFGVDSLIDTEGHHYRKLGLASARLSDWRWSQALAEEPLLLHQPLVRYGNDCTIGLAEDIWRLWIAR